MYAAVGRVSPWPCNGNVLLLVFVFFQFMNVLLGCMRVLLSTGFRYMPQLSVYGYACLG